MTRFERAVLVVILCLGAALRLWGVDFGLPGKFRPDEEYIVATALGFQSGDLNPRFFVYPPLFMYLVAAVYWLIIHLGEFFRWYPEGFQRFLELNLYAPAHLYARLISAVSGIIGIAAVYRLGSRARNSQVGLVAALLAAISFLHIRESHYATTDVASTLLSTLIFIPAILIARRSFIRDYLFAGLLLGAASATKYPAVMMVVPIVVAHLCALVKQKVAPWRELFGPGVAAASAAVTFFVCSPYLILDWKTFKENWEYQTPFLKNGLPVEGMTYGVDWLFGFALPHGFGLLPLLAASMGLIIGLKRLAQRREFDVVIIASFFIPLWCAFTTSRWIFLRYVVLLMPVITVLGAFAIDFLVARIDGERRRLLSALLLAILIGAAPLWRAIELNHLLSREDTRSLAKSWIAANVPAGAALLTHSTYYYGKPELPSGYRYRLWSEEGAGEERWLIVDDHPISFYSPPLSPEVQKFIEGRIESTVVFSPFEGAEWPAGTYDLLDAFYAPVVGAGALDRPGTRLTIYRLLPQSTAACKFASESIAPAQSLLIACHKEVDPNGCRSQEDNLFERGLEALEQCGSVSAALICKELGDPRPGCRTDAQCKRAEVAWSKYCAGADRGAAGE